jgi:hypothetical protein
MDMKIIDKPELEIMVPYCGECGMISNYKAKYFVIVADTNFKLCIACASRLKTFLAMKLESEDNK